MSASSSVVGRAPLGPLCKVALTTALLGASSVVLAQVDEAKSTNLIEKEVSKDSPRELAPVVVRGERMREITEGTGSYTTEQTSAATRLPLSLRETPQSVTVMTRQRMDDQQLNSVRDVLENTTGVSSSVLDTERVLFFSRGMEITGFQYDGIPTADVLGAFSPSDSLLDTISYDRIEVVRGATGLLSGWGNPSASINMVRKRPFRDFAASTSISAGSWDNYRATFDISAPLTDGGRVRARLAGAYQDKESYMDFYRHKKKSVFGTLEANLTSQTTLSIGYEYLDAKPKGAMWGGLPLFFLDGIRTDWSRSSNFGANWNKWDNTAETAFARLETHFDNGWTLKSNYSNRRTEVEANLFTTIGPPDRQTGAGSLGVALGEFTKTRQNNFDLMAEGPFELFGRKHELVIGSLWSKRVSNGDSTGPMIQFIPEANFYRWDGNIAKPDLDKVKYSRTNFNIEQSGIYSAARFSLADPLKLIVGARVSSYKIEQEASGRYTHYKDSGRFLPYAGIVYDLNSSHSVYASYTKIFSPQAQGYRDRNESVLPPTEGTNTEVGIKGEYFDGRLNAPVSLFEARLNDVPQVDVGHVLSDGMQAYYSAKGTKSQGIDFEIQGAPTDNLNVHLGVSHFTAFERDGNRLSSEIPRTTARLFATYRLPGSFNRLVVGGGLNWQSRFYRAVTSTVDVEQKAFATASLMARYDIAKGTSLAINVNNLFDKKYLTQVGMFNSYLYGEPRSVAVTLSHKF